MPLKTRCIQKTMKKHLGNRKDIPSPSLGKNFMDKILGLGIAVNDTWGYDVTISKFEIDNDEKRY